MTFTALLSFIAALLFKMQGKNTPLHKTYSSGQSWNALLMQYLSRVRRNVLPAVLEASIY